MGIWAEVSQAMSPEEWRYVGASVLGVAGLGLWVAGARRRASAGLVGDACPWPTYVEVLGAHGLPAERAGWAWQWMPWIRQSAEYFGVDPTLLAALIHTESTWNPYAGSSAGAVGLAQMMPATAVGRFRRLVEQERWPFGQLEENHDPQAAGYLAQQGVEAWLDRTDPHQSIWLGASLLRALYDEGFDYETTLAAYNAGGAAARRGADQWPGETKKYVPAVLRRQAWYADLEAACA